MWTPAEFAAARAAILEHDDDIADQEVVSRAAASAELDQRRKVFVAKALRDPRLAAGREAVALDRLKSSIRTALSIYLESNVSSDRAIHDATNAARSLGLLESMPRERLEELPVGGSSSHLEELPVGYRGLRVNGNRIAPSTGWLRPAEKALTDALAMMRRAARTMH